MSVETLITAREFAEMNLDDPCELVRGEIVPFNRPGIPHGIVCGSIAFKIETWRRNGHAGRGVCNNSCLLVAQQPDTVRGPDVMWISGETLKKHGIPKTYTEVPPTLAVEVHSPSDRWGEVLDKVGEYLGSGVKEVWVASLEKRTIHRFQQDSEPEILTSSDILRSPHLPGFEVNVDNIFAEVKLSEDELK